MDWAINISGHGKNFFDGLNSTDKRYLKEQMELIGKWASNDISNIGMLCNDSK